MTRSTRTAATLAFAAFATFGSASAFADGDVPSYPQPLTMGKSRMEVRAEVAAARAAGPLIVNEATVGSPAATSSLPASRAQVVMDLHRALARGEVHSLIAEPQGFTVPARAMARDAMAARG